MILTSLFFLFGMQIVFSSACVDLQSIPDEQKEVHLRLCKVEAELNTIEHALQELLSRTDMVIDSEKLNNALTASPEKRKNEFIRFGKRKNEFIRFGRSAPMEANDLGMAMTEKRKNEFIRFG